MDRATVQDVRRFNRTVTEQVGALAETYLGRGRPLGETRLLWEIGTDGAEVRALRRRLGIDAGYASRLLRSLEAEGMVVVEAGSGDRRVRRAQLTEAGLAERAELDRRADGMVISMLESLDERRRARLVEAMGDVERLLRASMVTIAVADPASADARWCMQQYFAELAVRFDAGFDPAASIPTGDLVPPEGLLVVAHLREQPVGCAALKTPVDSPPEVKRMWVAPEARGLGLGRRLLSELERHAKRGGATTIRLETNRALDEAVKMYRSADYREVAAFNAEPYAHHWFEKHL